MRFFCCLWIAVFLLSCGAPIVRAQQLNGNDEERAPWSYDETSTNGPSSWSTLPSTLAGGAAAFPACGAQGQSPIDISAEALEVFSASTAEALKPLDLSWPSASNISVERLTSSSSSADGKSLSLRIRFHDIQGIITDPSRADDETAAYDLLYADVRTASEHTFGGAHRDMEIQFMHQLRVGTPTTASASPTTTPQGEEEAGGTTTPPPATTSTAIQHSAPKYLAVSVSFVGTRYGHNALVRSVLTAAEKHKKSATATSSNLAPVDIVNTRIATMFPSSKDYYVYDGSLTHPPCTSDVRWIVMKEPSFVGNQELDKLRSVLGLSVEDESITVGNELQWAYHELGNVRPAQLRGDRIIRRYVDYSSVESSCPVLAAEQSATCDVCEDAVGRRMGMSVAGLFFGTVAFIVCVAMISFLTATK